MTRYYCPVCNTRGASTRDLWSPLCHKCSYKVRMEPYEFESEIRLYEPIETAPKDRPIELLCCTVVDCAFIMGWNEGRVRWEGIMRSALGPSWDVSWDPAVPAPTHWRGTLVMDKTIKMAEKAGALLADEHKRRQASTPKPAPDLMASMLLVLKDMLKNETTSAPGAHGPSPLYGYDMVRIFPERPGDEFIVIAQEDPSTTWRLSHTKK